MSSLPDRQVNTPSETATPAATQAAAQSSQVDGPIPTPNRLEAGAWKIIMVALLGPLMAQMDSTIVNVSLSSIKDALHSNVEAAQWVISGYLLTLALMLPLNGWIVDRLGAKRLYLWCFSAFTVASAICGMARTMDQLIAARLFQGIAGGLLAPLAQMMMARTAGKNMARVLGYVSMPVLLAPTFGPIVAGAILKYLSWSWLFYVNLPIGILAVVLAVILLPSDEENKDRRPFDFRGFALISPGLALVLYGFERASHAGTYSYLIIGLVFLAGFIWHALVKKSKALIDLELFRNSVFSAATITQFLSNAVMYAGQFLIPLYLTMGCGFSAETVGWILAPMGVGMICVYPMMGYFTDRFGCRAVSMGGVLLNTLGTLPFLWMSGGHVFPALVSVCLLFRGIGQGATGVPTIAAAYASVPKEKLGLATTALNIVQRLGGPTATTALAILVSMTVKTNDGSVHPSFLIPFFALFLIQLAVFASAARLPLRI